MVVAGLTGMIDPPRPEVKPAIAITAAALAVFRIGLSWFPDNIYGPKWSSLAFDRIMSTILIVTEII